MQCINLSAEHKKLPLQTAATVLNAVKALHLSYLNQSSFVLLTVCESQAASHNINKWPSSLFSACGV